MADVQRSYFPAAGHDWTLPLYDPLVKLLGIGASRRALLDQAGLHSARRVLDVGCGTGSLAVLIKRLHPGIDVVGLDPDPRALARARRKAGREGVSIQFDQGFSDELPYAEGTFDRVFSSFMFHHLEADVKAETMREARRVLKPGGSLHLVDFARPEVPAQGFLARWLRSSPRLEDNSEGRILESMNQAGLDGPTNIADGSVLFGHVRIGYYRASARARLY